MAKTLFEKIWDAHVVDEQDGRSLLYIDRHLVHEVTSPQAFDGLRMNKRKVRRPDLTFATMDHNVPTTNRSLPIVDQTSAMQIQALERSCKEFGIQLFDINSPDQGIVHVISPELGITLPGATIVCGDSHTSTQGAFGALAFGIGTSDVEHVLATQCIWMENPKTDSGAKFDKSFTIHTNEILPQVSWGTNPAMTVDVTGRVPFAQEYAKGNPEEEKAANRALEYMGLKPGTLITDITIDRVFIGSCTNSRLEDLIEASKVVKGKRISPKVQAMIVPGSQNVKRQAEEIGLDKIFKDAGFEWRESGCSMCLGMNPDILATDERCASTSNRNFEGRQGVGGRTHLVSPVMAAAASIYGHFVDVREMDLN